MKLIDFQNLISNLPINHHSFSIKYANWQNESMQYEIDQIFTGKTKISLTRWDLFSAFHFDVKTGILKTLMWGYPIKGRGNNIDNILKKENFYKLVSILESYKKISVTEFQLAKDIKSIEGLGLSTMSKFLYFMRVNVENYPALILDRKIIDILREKVFEEFKPISDFLYPVSTNKYVKYLKLLYEISINYKVFSENIEMFIFIFGKNISQLKGEECYDDFSSDFDKS